MRRLLPYLGFLPLILLLAVTALAQEEAQPGWDPMSVCGGERIAERAIAAVVFGAIFGVVIGLAGPWRAHLHNLRVEKIYKLNGSAAR